MIVPLYIISLGLAAGLAGVAGHHFFSSLGFTPDFHGSLMLASGIASGYLALQLLYTAVVRLIKPSKGPAFYLFETLSQASAIVLIPYLLKLPIPWPHPALKRSNSSCFSGYLPFYTVSVSSYRSLAPSEAFTAIPSPLWDGWRPRPSVRFPPTTASIHGIPFYWRLPPLHRALHSSVYPVLFRRLHDPFPNEPAFPLTSHRIGEKAWYFAGQPPRHWMNPLNACQCWSPSIRRYPCSNNTS